MGAVARPRDTVNLRGRPKARRDQAGGESRPWPGPAVPGRVTPRRDATMDYLQPSPTAPPRGRDAVQRLNDGGSGPRGRA
jgi:hypothetical protein